MGKDSKLKPWKVTESKYLVQDRWLNLRADCCETSKGVQLNPYYILEVKDWADVVAFDQQMNMILVRQYRHGVQKVIYELPGGIVENGDPSETAASELKEETGYIPGELALMSSFYPNPAKYTNQAHSFLATNCEPGEQELESAEEIEVCVFTIDQVLELIEKGEMRQGYHIGGIYLALRRLGLLKSLA